MLTLNGQPYITLDKYLDIPKFLNLRNDFEFLVSNSWEHIRTGVWNAGGHSPEDYYNAPEIFREKGLLYYVYRQANEDRKTDEKLDQHLSHFEKKDDLHGLSRYLKLRYEAYDPYNILNIRKTYGPYYAADSYVFTAEDWEKYYWEDYMDDYPAIKDFIVNDLPFDEIGVVTLFYNEHFVIQNFHRDFNYFPYEKGNKPETFPHRQELIWLRFDLDRPFSVFELDIENGKVIKEYPVRGYSAFFNHHNWHGCFKGSPYTSITLKVEGKFTDEFRKQIGVDNLEYYYYES